MNVMIVMPSASPRGGAEEALVQLLENAGDAGLELRIVFLEHGELVDRVRRSTTACTVINAGRLRNPLRFMKTVANLYGLIGHWRIDVVVGWMTKAHIYGGLAAMLAGVPAVCFQMGVPDRGIVDRFSRWIPATGMLTCSEFAAGEQRRVVRCPVFSVPLAVDGDRFDVSTIPAPEQMKRRLDFSPGQPLVGIVGRLQRWKGIHVFLEAMAMVHRVHAEVRGVVVGGLHDLESDYPELLKRQVEALSLKDVVRMVGVQRNVSEWMQAMDVVVHASDREPFGIVVVEAMALGKAVVASIPGGPEEIVENERSGLLVHSGDPSQLASAIRRFLEEPQLLRSCADAAKIRAKEFSTKAFVRRFSAALTKLVSEKRCPRSV